MDKGTYTQLEFSGSVIVVAIVVLTSCIHNHNTHGNVCTVLPQIMAREFISFQQLFTLATKRDRRLYETGIY